MQPSSFILADHDTEALIKLAAFAIFAILWGIKSIANLAKPKPKGPASVAPPPMPPALPRMAAQQRMPRPVQMPTPPRMPAPGRMPTPQRTPVPHRMPTPARMSAPPPLPSLAARRNPPAAPRPAVAQAKIASIFQALTNETSAPRKTVAVPVVPAAPGRVQNIATASSEPATPSRSSIAKWVDARTLRSQFILAEALKPPIALRRESRW